jgi:hypothetical protein
VESKAIVRDNLRGGGINNITVLPDSLASPARPSGRSSVTITLYEEGVRMVRDVVRYKGCGGLPNFYVSLKLKNIIWRFNVIILL